MFYAQKLFKKINHPVYEIMWKNVVQPDNIIRIMHFACWIPKVIDTHSEYVIIFVLPQH